MVDFKRLTVMAIFSKALRISIISSSAPDEEVIFFSRADLYSLNSLSILDIFLIELKHYAALPISFSYYYSYYYYIYPELLFTELFFCKHPDPSTGAEGNSFNDVTEVYYD